MTDHPPDHAPFEELAAGYALDALEPADEQRYLQHARQCPACTRALAEFREVTVALAETVPPAEPRAQLGERIMAVALADLDLGRQAGTGPGDPAPPADFARPADFGRTADSPSSSDFGQTADSPPPADFGRAANATPAANFALPPRRDPGAAPGDAGDRPGHTDAIPADAGAAPEGAGAGPADVLPPGVAPLRPRSRRWLRPASAAAAAALIAGGGIWAGLAATGGSSPPPPSASCARVAGCTEIPLTATGTHRTAAQLIVDQTTAWMSPRTLPANPSDEIYVLWQITGSNPPLAVGSFDVRAGTHGLIKVGPLAASFPGTSAFAVSLEHGRTIPASPSRVLASGKV